MSLDLINAYSSDGFVYVGRAQLASRPHTHQHADNSSSSSIGSKESSPNSSEEQQQQQQGSFSFGKVLPSWVSAVRFTPQGHVYVAKEQDSQQLQQQQQTDADLSIQPQVPAAATRRRLAASSSSSSHRRLGPAAAAAAGSLQRKGRQLNIMVGADERKICPLGPTYPFSAIGQIDFEEAGTPYICSGALISQRRVLTAAHCVWDVDSQSFVDVLSFAPGRFRWVAASAAVIAVSRLLLLSPAAFASMLVPCVLYTYQQATCS
jgi:V8-like Glu-specific endopeptidase